MEVFDWSVEKNAWLRKVRGISFEDILLHTKMGDLLDVIEHTDHSKYRGQRIFVVNVEGYAYMVPFVEAADRVFLKTIIPSRKMTKRYLGVHHDESD